MRRRTSTPPSLRSYVRDHFFGVLPALTFLWTRWRYYRSLGPVLPAQDAAQHISDLHRRGVVLIRGLFPAEVLADMQAAIPEISEFTQSPEGDRSYMYRDADRIAALEPFFQHPLLTSIVKGYISRDAICLRRTIGQKRDVGDFTTFETYYHMDTWKHRVKIFLLLDDVDVDNAPMVYLAGSHRGYWRRWTEQRIHRYYRNTRTGFAAGGPDYWFLGAFWPHEAQQLKHDFGYEDVYCTGAAGTVIVFDGRGLHRATPLRRGRRLILTSYWIHPGHHI